MVDTTGAIKLCCVADDPTVPDKYGNTNSSAQQMHIKKQNLGDAWNSEYMLSCLLYTSPSPRD